MCVPTSSTITQCHQCTTIHFTQNGPLLPSTNSSYLVVKAPDKLRISTHNITPISPQNPMFDRLLELSHRDDSNKWSNIGFCEEVNKYS